MCNLQIPHYQLNYMATHHGQIRQSKVSFGDNATRERFGVLIFFLTAINNEKIKQVVSIHVQVAALTRKGAVLWRQQLNCVTAEWLGLGGTSGGHLLPLSAKTGPVRAACPGLLMSYPGTPQSFLA